MNIFRKYFEQFSPIKPTNPDITYNNYYDNEGTYGIPIVEDNYDTFPIFNNNYQDIQYNVTGVRSGGATKTTTKTTESAPKESTAKQSTTPRSFTSNSSVIQKVIEAGRKQLKKPYKTGTHGPSSFDCSGLMYYAFKQGGIDIPLNIFKMTAYGKSVSLSEAQPGDIIVTPGNGKSGLHVKLITEVNNGKIKVLEAKGKKWGVVEGWLTNTSNIKSIRRVV